MRDGCDIEHDWFTAFLTFGLCCGLIVSYLPQHLRIIQSKSSEGLSPLFLLLGSTSAASAMLNMLTMQSGVVKCCGSLGAARCVEISAGIIQLSIQWVAFSFIFVLYMIYYPEHLKYEGVRLPTDNATVLVKNSTLQPEWRLSIIFARLTVIHFIVAVFTTLFILVSAVPSPAPGVPLPPAVYSWARFLGISAAVLASVQYAPQLLHTYRTKLVGALSIPMMCIQTPGGILMVTSIALRPGTNWTSWITFAVAAVLQGTLLIMCIFWKRRQNRLGIDDFGAPLAEVATPGLQIAITVSTLEDHDDTPSLLVTTPSGSTSAPAEAQSGISDERTPLLGSR